VDAEWWFARRETRASGRGRRALVIAETVAIVVIVAIGVLVLNAVLVLTAAREWIVVHVRIAADRRGRTGEAHRAEIATGREWPERSLPPDGWMGGSHFRCDVQRKE
jgi:hypothetical protein